MDDRKLATALVVIFLVFASFYVSAWAYAIYDCAANAACAWDTPSPRPEFSGI